MPGATIRSWPHSFTQMRVNGWEGYLKKIIIRNKKNKADQGGVERVKTSTILQGSLVFKLSKETKWWSWAICRVGSVLFKRFHIKKSFLSSSDEIVSCYSNARAVYIIWITLITLGIQWTRKRHGRRWKSNQQLRRPIIGVSHIRPRNQLTPVASLQRLASNEKEKKNWLARCPTSLETIWRRVLVWSIRRFNWIGSRLASRLLPLIGQSKRYSILLDTRRTNSRMAQMA